MFWFLITKSRFVCQIQNLNYLAKWGLLITEIEHYRHGITYPYRLTVFLARSAIEIKINKRLCFILLFCLYKILNNVIACDHE